MRFYFTNTANTRLFNVALPGARMKLVGGDSGRYEHETFVDEVLLAPSERAIVDVLFDDAGHVPTRAPHTRTTPTSSAPSPSATTPVDESLRRRSSRRSGRAPELTAERARHRRRPRPRARQDAAFESLMPLLYGDPDAAADTWTCPMHPEVISDEPGTCPHCGMKLIPPRAPSTWTCPMHPEVVSTRRAPARLRDEAHPAARRRIDHRHSTTTRTPTTRPTASSGKT